MGTRAVAACDASEDRGSLRRGGVLSVQLVATVARSRSTVAASSRSLFPQPLSCEHHPQYQALHTHWSNARTVCRRLGWLTTIHPCHPPVNHSTHILRLFVAFVVLSVVFICLFVNLLACWLVWSLCHPAVNYPTHILCSSSLGIP